MKLHEIFEELAYGEVSDLSMAQDGLIKEDQQAKVTIKINDTLLSLYTKYVIKLVDAQIITTTKALRYDFINPNSVKIVYAHPELPNPEAIYRNEDHFAIQGNSIVFKKLPEMDELSITYQWKPSKLKINPTSRGFLDQEVNIDPVLSPLVRTLVASSIFNGMNGEAHKASGVGLYNQAKIMQAELEASGALTTSVAYENQRFYKNGFR